MDKLSATVGPLINAAQQAKTTELNFKKDIAIAAKTLDIAEEQGAQVVDMINKVGQNLDVRV